MPTFIFAIPGIPLIQNAVKEAFTPPHYSLNLSFRAVLHNEQEAYPLSQEFFDCFPGYSVPIIFNSTKQVFIFKLGKNRFVLHHPH